MRERILAYLADNPGASGKSLKRFVCDSSATLDVVRALVTEGLVVDDGGATGHRYRLPSGTPVPIEPTQRHDFAAEERSRRAARRHREERDRIAAELVDAQARADILADWGAVDREPAGLGRREPRSGLREGALVALASDWHVEEAVTPAQSLGRNRYDLGTAQRRAGRFFGGIEWMLRHHRQAYQVRDLVLWLGGDLITGHIHEENVETSQLSPSQATLAVFDWIADGIGRLLADDQIERIVVPCNYGNHGRTTHRMRYATGALHSWEWLAYRHLASRFANEPRVTVHAPQSSHVYLEAYGRTLHFHHGDEVRGGGGVGGIAVPLLRRVPRWDSVRRADLHHVGHFHQARDFHSVVVNGSLIGYNAFAASIGASYEPPAQQCYLLDAKRGKCFVTPLWVDEDASAGSAPERVSVPAWQCAATAPGPAPSWGCCS